MIFQSSSELRLIWVLIFNSNFQDFKKGTNMIYKR